MDPRATARTPGAQDPTQVDDEWKQWLTSLVRSWFSSSLLCCTLERRWYWYVRDSRDTGREFPTPIRMIYCTVTFPTQRLVQGLLLRNPALVATNSRPQPVSWLVPYPPSPPTLRSAACQRRDQPAPPATLPIMHVTARLSETSASVSITSFRIDVADSFLKQGVPKRSESGNCFPYPIVSE